jgi:hypothetical protein
MANPNPTETELSKLQQGKLLNEAISLITKATSSTQKNLGQLALDSLLKTTTEMQVLVNSAFNKGGVLTKEQYDSLDEQARKAKLQILAAQNKSTTTKYLFYGLGIIVGLGALWFITKDKK